MSKPEDSNLESLVSTAQQLGPDARSQFLLLLLPETRIAVERVLEGRKKMSDRTLIDDDREQPINLGATVVVETSEFDDAGSTDERLEVRVSHPFSSKTLVEGAEGVDDEVHYFSPAENFAEDIRRSNPQRAGVHLVKLHARGAIGEVFVAYDEKLSREVAIKRIRPELPASKRRTKRFLREAVITAKLQHPGIVPVYTMGDAGGSPHYTMPLVSGVTMAEKIQETHDEIKHTTSPQRWMSALRPLLRNFIAACYAVDYAHTENVVHRDIKPSNILIGGRGQTMVVDWGCAKDIDDPESQDDSPSNDEGEEQSTSDSWEDSGSGPKKTKTPGGTTISGSVMGTVEFMSPEQAAGDNASVGRQSDVFGLGATLFSLLTNSRAIEFDSTGEVRAALAKVKRGEFRRIEEIDTRVPMAIGAVCQRAMAFKPEDRYATAGALGRDVEAFLAGDVVRAYEEPFHDRMTRFIKRHKTMFTTLVGILLAGFFSMTVINLVVNRKNGELASLNHQLTDMVSTERELRAEANRSEDLTKKRLYGNQMLLASEASTEPGGLGRMRELVSNWSHKSLSFTPGWEWQHLKSLGSRELWGLNEEYTANQIITTRESPFARVFDRAASKILTIDLVNQKATKRENISFDCSVVDFNRDQSQIAQGHTDGRVTVWQSSGQLNDDTLVRASHHEHASKVTDLKWNIGGDLLASCDDRGNVVVWHAGDQEVVARGEDALQVSGKGLLAWSYDGHQLFWTTGKTIKRLDVATKKQKTIVTDDWISDLCNSHEGELLAYIGPENTIVVCDLQGKGKHRFEGHQLFVESLRWHPAKHLLLSCSADGSVRIWDANTKKEVRQLMGHEGHVYSATWNSTGTRVMSGGFPEDALRLWDVSDVGKEAFDRELNDRPAVDWHPSGESLVVAEGIDLVVQNNGGDSRWIRAEDRSALNVHGVAFHPQGDLIACVAGDGKVWTVDAETGEVKTVYDSGSGGTLFPTISSRGVQWSPDGNYLAGVGGDGKLHVWDFADGKLVSESVDLDRVLAVAWSPIAVAGEQRVAAVGAENDFVIFDPATGKTVQRIVQAGWKTGLAWSPDGKQLAVSDRRSVRVWDTQDGSVLGVCDGPSAMVADLDWSSTQNRFAALTEDGKICVWDSQALTYLAKFALHSRAPYCIRWSPDGQRLVSTTRYGRIVFQNMK